MRIWREGPGAAAEPLVCVSMLAIAALIAVHLALGASQAGAAGSGAQAVLPPVEPLQLRHTTVFPAQAPAVYRSGTQCDSDGHAFVQPAAFAGVPPRIEPSSSVSELIPDEERIVAFRALPLPESRYPHAALLSFAVLPDGKLYALIFTRRISSKGKPLSGPEYYVERFKDDGARDSLTHVDKPPGVAHWYADLLAPFPDGGFLIAGTSTATKERPGAGSWRPFTAVYSSDGRFVREVKLPHDIANNFNEGGGGKSGTAGKAKAGASAAQAAKPQQYFDVEITTGGLVSGPGGNVWILRASDPIRLYAVDSSGQVVQHIEFSPPAPGLTPFDFGFVSPGEIYFDFTGLSGGPAAPSSGRSEVIGVFHTAARQFEALYKVSEKANGGPGSLACSDGNGGFLFLGSTSYNRFAVLDYAPR